MTRRTLLVLLFVLVALLAVVVWFEPPKKEETSGAAKTLATILPAALDALKALETEGLQAPVRIEKRGGSLWQLVLPFAAEADPREVKSFYDGLTAVPIERVIEETGADLSKFGLHPPAGRIRVFAAARPEPYELAVGRSSPVGDKRYAADGLGRVLLLGSTLTPLLERNPDTLRERRLLPVDASEVRRLSSAAAGGTVTLEKNGDGWNLVQPFEDQADSSAVDTLVRAAVGLSAAEFPGSEESGSGFRDPELTVTLTVEGGKEPIGAQFGAEGPSGKRWARRSTGEFLCLVDPSAVSSLRRTPHELRERRVAFAEATDVLEIVIRSGEAAGVTAQRDAAEKPWSVRDGSSPSKEAAPHVVDDLLERLRWVRADSFEPAGAGAPRAKRTVLLHGVNGELGRLEFLDDPAATNGAPAAGAPAIRVRSSWRPGLILGIPAGGVGSLPASAADLVAPPQLPAQESKAP